MSSNSFLFSSQAALLRAQYISGQSRDTAVEAGVVSSRGRRGQENTPAAGDSPGFFTTSSVLGSAEDTGS